MQKILVEESWLIFFLSMLVQLTLLAQPAQAAENIQDKESLYSVSVEVTSQSIDQRQAAFKKGLKEVLVKVSGRSDVLKSPKIEQDLTQPESLVDKFHYQALPADEDNASQFLLLIKFNSKAINELLTQAHQLVWSKERPLTMVWLATEDGPEGRQLLGSDSDSDLTSVVQRTADERGASFMLPLLDLTDLADLTVNDVWQSNREVIEEADGRYSAHAALVGNLGSDKEGWHGQWRLWVNSTEQTWQSSAPDLPSLVKKGINAAVDELATQFASAPSTNISGAAKNDSGTVNALSADKEASTPLSIVVYGIDDMESYRKVTSYLGNLSGVSSLAVQTIGSDYVVYELSMLGGAEELAASFKRDHLLSPNEKPLSKDAAVTSVRLNYRLTS